MSLTEDYYHDGCFVQKEKLLCPFVMVGGL